jgi:hypothetical protein
MHSDLSARLAISEAHVRYLYQHLYLPLLACHERQQRGRLAQVAKEAQTQHSCHQPPTRTSRYTCEQLTLSSRWPDSGKRCAD